ncbi:hypothetical protein F6R98_05790 [Candidatus Methylospira mobilis]|uniref:Glutathione metabolism protein n=1 Tax=Candidatus Methylospira mobilis TaxID=1808979 RepID=A0A5Q0BJ22_9GAMM|nr:MAPEG family protein [Candidatus Methylospira mobilis]QFY42201.1 hypothetical protein F6R98_05790 [Candidatus Methylospira mobilis]WNV03216.1 MAPEG family protein [Candidatus Methylospira mobilis]
MASKYTGFYAALLGLLFVFLSMRVITLRMKLKVSVGDGGHELLTRAIRIHGNFAEYVPFALLLMLLNELAGASMWLIHALGVSLIAARILHIKGIATAESPMAPRKAGMMLTFAVVITGSLSLLFRSIW